ncbi:MAG: phage portal protein, partial [Phycisphaerae bacterium]
PRLLTASGTSADIRSSAPLEPAQVVLFHDDRTNAGAMTAAWRRRATSSRAAWLLDRFARWLAPRFNAADSFAGSQSTTVGGTDAAFHFDLWSAERWQRYHAGALAEEGANPLGFVPVIPFINQVTPLAGLDAFDLPGLSEVEPLLSLQDELNTRLSDRASRVTMQSFRMYLVKGIDDAAVRPIGPGQMWTTTNLDANISSFGGDMAAPSEDAHINEIREALDKISGVSPVAAGLIRGRLGNLTSAVALKITLIALLARTEKRRTALTATLAVLCRRILEVLDAAGVFGTTPEERGIDVNYPSALPENTAELLADAKAKLDLGISRRTVLTELGYAEEVS